MLQSGLLRWVMAVFALIFAASVGAESLAETATTKMGEVVVTATRMEEEGFEVPTPVSVVDQGTMEMDNPSTVAQPLAELPGVSMAHSDPWQATPVIRGLGDSRVLVLIDGDRESNLWSGRAPLIPFLDVSDVERIEVIKGPASVLYGTDALGGVINIITKKPSYAQFDHWTLKNSGEVRYSSVDEGWFSRYQLSGGGHGVDFLLAVSKRNAGSYEDGGGHEVENSQYEATNVNFRGRYLFKKNHQVEMNIRVNNINDMGIPQKFNADYSHFTKFNTDTYKVAYHGRELGCLDDLQLRVWYVDQERNYDGKIPSEKKPVYTLKSNEIETSALGFLVQAERALGARNQLVTGFEFVREDADGDEDHMVRKARSHLNVTEKRFKPIPDSKREHFGVFAQDEMKVGERLKLLAGLRYDYFLADAGDVAFKTYRYSKDGKRIVKKKVAENNFSRKSDSAITFNLGLLYQLYPHVNLTTNLSSGFRAPDIFERYSTRGGGAFVIIGDPDLDPEYSYNIDLGVKLNYSRVYGSFDLFYNRVDDYIDLVHTDEKFSGMEVRRYVNTNAELYGFDGSLDFVVVEGLTLFGNVAYVVGRDRDSHDRLNRIPPLNGVVGLRWKDETSRGLRYWVEFNSVMYDRQDHPAKREKETAGYAVFNLRSGVKFGYKRLKDVGLTLNVENLFDKRYRNHLNPFDFINDPGMNVVVALRASF